MRVRQGGRGVSGGGSRRRFWLYVLLIAGVAIYAVIAKPAESADAIQTVASAVHTFVTSF